MKKTIISILVLIINNVYSQDADNKYFPTIFTASPHAASLTKIGEVPVDMSTGKNNYKLPIFEINEGDIKLPIFLSYNYNGLQYDELIGYTGVGWNLNIGGSISKKVKGLPDDDSPQNLGLIDMYPDLMDIEQQSLTLGRISDEMLDGEPDKFMLNIGRLNASFYLDKNKRPIFLNNELYKIEIIYSGDGSIIGYKVLDDEGIEYYFDIRETIYNATNNAEIDHNYTSSWLISRIFSKKTNKEVIFQYDDPKILNQTLVNNTIIKEQNDMLGFWITEQNRENIQNNTIYTRPLKKIITSDYEINLHYNSIINTNKITINKIEIKRNNAELLKFEFNFYDWINNRVLLKNIKFNDDFLSTFDYYGSLPDVTYNDENVKDLWGFFNNGENNLKPFFETTIIGALKKITYPNKGFTEIEYEPNQILTSVNDYKFHFEADVEVYNKFEISTYTGRPSIPFTLNSNKSIEIDFEFKNNDSILQDKFAKISIIDENNVIVFYKEYVCNWELQWICTNNTNVMKGFENINLAQGNYLLKVESSVGAGVIAKIKYLKDNFTFNQKIGGIRVKSIRYCDGEDCKKSNFDYNIDSMSSGILLQTPEYHSGFYVFDQLACDGTTYNRKDYYTNSNIYPLSIYNGSPVIYKKVTKTNESSNSSNNGKIEYSFSGNSNNYGEIDEVLLLKSGKLKEEVYYDNNSQVKSRINYFFSDLPINTSLKVKSLRSKLVYDKYNFLSTVGGSYECVKYLPIPTTCYNYKLKIFKPTSFQLSKVVSLQFFNNDTIITPTYYTYYYPSGKLHKTINKYSDNTYQVTEYKYPESNDTNFGWNILFNENIIKDPVEITQFYSTDSLNYLMKSKIKRIYRIENDIPVLDKIEETNKDNTIEGVIFFTKYDDKGNILEYKKINNSDKYTSIIWGYNQTQPVAKIEGIAYNSINAALITAIQTATDSATATENDVLTALNNLRSSLSLTGTMVSTYTYKPLIGISTITDPKGDTQYYTYDNFNRLQFVKDKNGNILSENEYHYRD